MRWLDEFEAALCVYIRDAPTKATSVNSGQATFLFIVLLQPNGFQLLFLGSLNLMGFSCCSWEASETGDM